MKSCLRALMFMLIFSINISCKSQVTGIYASELESGVKHLSSSSLELKADNTFKLIHSFTSLEFTVPSTRINEFEGKFEKGKDQVKLIPGTKRVNWLTYGKNPDSLNMNSVGVRVSAMVVIDTIYGQVQSINETEHIILNITTMPNSKYLWNEQNCYIKFDHSDVSNDLKNYCSEIRRGK